MSVFMYQASAVAFDKHLAMMQAYLGKGAAHAAEKKIEEAVLTGMRIFPDMFPLTRQIMIACDFAKGASARLAGVDVPKFEDTEKSFAELQSRVQKTRDFLSTLKAEQFAEAATRKVTISIGGNPVEFVGEPYLFNFALPNFYFHSTTAYNLLRHAGVPVGKGDFVSRG